MVPRCFISPHCWLFFNLEKEEKSNCFVPQAPLGTTGNQRLGQEHGLSFAAELSRSGSSPATATDTEGRQNHLVRNICKNIHAHAIFIIAYIFLNTRIRYFIRSFSLKWTFIHSCKSDPTFTTH